MAILHPQTVPSECRMEHANEGIHSCSEICLQLQLHQFAHLYIPVSWCILTIQGFRISMPSSLKRRFEKEPLKNSKCQAKSWGVMGSCRELQGTHFSDRPPWESFSSMQFGSQLTSSSTMQPLLVKPIGASFWWRTCFARTSLGNCSSALPPTNAPAMHSKMLGSSAVSA